MGDRYTIDIKCSHCNKLNTDVWYAESCGHTTFKCSSCGKHNQMVMSFTATKLYEHNCLKCNKKYLASEKEQIEFELCQECFVKESNK